MSVVYLLLLLAGVAGCVFVALKMQSAEPKPILLIVSFSILAVCSGLTYYSYLGLGADFSVNNLLPFAYIAIVALAFMGARSLITTAVMGALSLLEIIALFNLLTGNFNFLLFLTQLVFVALSLLLTVRLLAVAYNGLDVILQNWDLLNKISLGLSALFGLLTVIVLFTNDCLEFFFDNIEHIIDIFDGDLLLATPILSCITLIFLPIAYFAMSCWINKASTASTTDEYDEY